MADHPHAEQSRQEAVQPSLWDRILDDLPELLAECARLAADLGREVGEDRLQRLLAAGRRACEAEPDLDGSQRRALARLLAVRERRVALEVRGIVVTPAVLREAVRRDLEALFNVERLEIRPLLTPAEAERVEAPADLLASFPRVRSSVLNFGVPSFAGRRARDFDPARLSRELRDVVVAHEPRLRPDSVVVRVVTHERTGLRIEVEAVLVMTPVPERLRLSTTIDLDNGRASTRLEEA